MPPPAGVKEMAKTAVRTMIGEQPLLLLDKLGERLAFERAGTRLYEALLSKHDARRTFTGGPSRDEIAHIRDEELQHMQLVNDAIAVMKSYGAVIVDPADIPTAGGLECRARFRNPSRVSAHTQGRGAGDPVDRSGGPGANRRQSPA